MDTGHPNFKYVKWANFGTEEEWVARVSLGLLELLDGLKLGEKERYRAGEAFREMTVELDSAFIGLCNVRKLEGAEDIALLELHKEYDAIYDHLWRAYKDRLQTFASTIGYNIGFLFKNDADFESGAIAFQSAHSRVRPGFIDMLREDRRTWQNKLAHFRNEVLQHKQEGSQTGPYFTLDVAELVFVNVWQAVEEIVVSLIEARLMFPFAIYEIAPEERDSACPRRFQIGPSPALIDALNNSL